MANTIVSAGNYPQKHSKRENKIIETCLSGTGALTGKTIDGDLNTVQDLPVTALKTVAADADKVVRYATTTGVVGAAKIVNANVDAAAAIAQSKLSLAITTAEIATNAANADKVLRGATTTGAPEFSKVQEKNLDCAAGTVGQFLQSNGSGVLSFATAAYAEKTATVTVSEANLLAMNGATGGDKELVAAQAGVVYIPYALQIFADFDTAEYTAGDDLVLVAGTVAAGTVLANFDKTAFIPGTSADAHFFMNLDTAIWDSSATAKGVDITALANTALSLNIKSGGTQFTDPGTAAGIFKVKVYYREIALLS